jgi:hypothetical protein
MKYLKTLTAAAALMLVAGAAHADDPASTTIFGLMFCFNEMGGV